MSFHIPVDMAEVLAVSSVDTSSSQSTYVAPPVAESYGVEATDETSDTSSKITALTASLKDNLKIAQKTIAKGLHKAVQKLDKALTEDDSDDLLAENLVAVLAEQLQCQWCRDVLNGPVSLPCGHSFCAECWTAVRADPAQQDGTATICPSIGCGVPVPADAQTPMIVALCGAAAVVRARVEADRERRQHERDASDAASDADEEAQLRAMLGASEPTPTALDGTTTPAEESTFGSLWGRVKAKSMVVGAHLKEGYHIASEKAVEQYRLVKEKLDKGNTVDASGENVPLVLNATDKDEVVPPVEEKEEVLPGYIDEPIELDDARFTLEGTQ